MKTAFEFIAILMVLLLSSLALAQPVGSPAAVWMPLASAQMDRDEAPSAVIDDKMYVFGGFINSDLEITNTVEVYDPATNTWTMRAPMPVPVTHAGAATVDKTVWLVGGFEGNHPGPVTDAVQVYDADADAWQMGPPLPEARASGTLVRLGRKLHFFGGLKNRNDDVGTHYVLDLANPDAGWTTAAPLPQPRNHLSGSAFAGKVYAIGGQFRHRDRQFVAYLHAYDPQTDTWERRADLPAARSHFESSTFVHEGLIFIGGGVADTPNATPAVNHLTAYDPVADTWESLEPLPKKLLGPVLKVVDERLILSHGGLNQSYYPQKDAYGRPAPSGPGDRLGFWPNRIELTVPVGDRATGTTLLGTLGRLVSYTITASTSAEWLNVRPKNGMTDASGREVAIEVEASELAPGTYTTTLHASAPGFEATPLDLVVTVSPNTDAAFSESSGLVVMEAENYHADLPRGEHAWTQEAPSGSVGTAMHAGPDTGANINSGYTTTSPELQYEVAFQTTGTYYVWARVFGPSYDEDSFHVGLDGRGPATADRIKTGTQGSWVWTNVTMDNSSRARLQVSTAGVHEVNLWMREDGVLVDRLLLTTDEGFTPTGDGPPESPTTAPPPFSESGGQLVMEAEHFHTNTPRSGHAWSTVSPSGSVGAAMEATPNTGTNINTGYATTSPELAYQVQFQTTGTYYVWARVFGPSYDEDSFHVGLDGRGPATADRIKTGVQGSWVWTNVTMDNSSRARLQVSTAGVHEVNLWMREDGVLVDRLLLTTDEGFTPTGDGPPESLRQGDSGLEVIAEAGTVTFTQAGSDQWHPVTLAHSFSTPVVVTGPLSFNDGQPATVRVRSVTPTGFEFQLDEWNYLDGQHTQEILSYLVVEAGRHQLDDGRVLEAGLAPIDAAPTPVPFGQTYNQAPVVISQVVSTNEEQTVVTRQQNVSVAGFEVFLQEQADGSPGPETVAWVALEAGTGTTGSLPYEAGRTADVVTHTFFAVTFLGSFSGTPAFLAALQTTNGLDPATLRYRLLNMSSVEVKVEEEQSSDNETNHVGEAVGYLAFAPGLIRGLSTQPGVRLSKAEQAALEAVALGTAAETLPEQYALQGNYPNPFNPVTTIRYALPELAQVRLEVFDVRGRQVAVLVEEEQAAGRYTASFEAEALPSGVYFYRLVAGPYVITDKMLLIK